MSTAAFATMRSLGGTNSNRTGQLDKQSPVSVAPKNETSFTLRLGGQGRANHAVGGCNESTNGDGDAMSQNANFFKKLPEPNRPQQSKGTGGGGSMLLTGKKVEKIDGGNRRIVSELADDDDDDDEDDEDEDDDENEDNDDEEENGDDDEDEEEEDNDDEDDDEDDDDDDEEDVVKVKANGSPIKSHENQPEAEETETETESEDDEATDPELVTSTERKFHIDDFQIIKTVGTGTFGRVCLCRDRIINKYCAMKILAMCDVIRLKQIEHVKNERNILQEIKHPFVISLLWSTKDNSCLYMIFEYVCGGELFSYLRNEGRFTSEASNFYAAEIVLALEYLHTLQIVYRDLKPENLLINRDGHLKITDFGFAKKLRDRTWTLCGTPEYLAPEIIQSKGHNKAVDWWALGVLIYEMLVGYPPFYDDNPFGIYEKILGGKIEWPRHMDPIAKDLVKKLLVNDRTKRLGNMKNGADDVKRHRWFKHLNWMDVYNKKLKPPIIPIVSSDGDTSNFDDYPENEYKPVLSVSQRDFEFFRDF